MKKIRNNNLALYKITDDKIIILNRNANLQLQAKLFINNTWSKWINLKKTIKGTPMLCVIDETRAFIFIVTLNNLFYYSTLTFENNIVSTSTWTLLKYDHSNLPTFIKLENNLQNTIYMFTVNQFNEACYKLLPYDKNYILDTEVNSWINID